MPTDKTTDAQAEFDFGAYASRKNLYPFEVQAWIGCKYDHLVRLIESGELPHAFDIRSKDSLHACWRIPRQDVIDLMKKRNVGSYVPDNQGNNAC